MKKQTDRIFDLDTAHGYYNETGVGQGIIDSGIPREEIWVTNPGTGQRRRRPVFQY